MFLTAIAQRLIGAHQFVFDLLINAARDEDALRGSQFLKAHRDVDAIAVNV